MSQISERLSRRGKRAGFIPFMTAGFPRADSTVAMLHALAGAGADVIEVGVPFSDPMADGAAIQRANQAALANGMTLAKTLQQCAEFRQKNAATPLVLMGYANSFINYGDGFPAAAAAAGINGLIIVDMADADRDKWRAALDAAGVDLIALIAPTTAPARARALAAAARGFVYLISLRGVTGAANLQVDDISALAKDIAAATDVPLAIGFGVRTTEQAAAAAQVADAVVVGSVLMEIAEDAAATGQDAPRAVAAFAKQLSEALR